MRIEFLTQDDPLYVLPFFDEFVRHYVSEFQILQIATSPVMGKRSRSQMIKELTQLYGPVGMVRLTARVAGARILGKLPKRAGASRYSTLSQLCHSHGILHEKIGNPNASEFVESVRRRGADLLVSVACPYILKAPLLTIAPKGAINIHHAPLPRYKGMMPTFWQMFHGEKSVGLTIHYMSARIDEGEALLQEKQAIEPGESLDHLIQRSKRYGAHCMAQVLRQIRDGRVERTPLDHSQGSYFTFPTAEEIREFRRRGNRAI
jgi:methionyl-tRNA formyltransferase